MPQSNFNPEKEPTPERKWWNVFERQSEFEEPEKEKQPEMLVERAKELKSAAKERGHFWETFMPRRDDSENPEEIAPKGEKVRKKWRALLRRKSEKQVEEFKEEDPEVIDSYWLAQLMVAERILTLHTQLTESEPKTDERRQIKTELDVLGLLSEKLSDPDVEVPAEIEDTYRVIVNVLEQGDSNIPIEELPVIKDTPEDSRKPEHETRECSFQKYGIAVIVALRQAVKNSKPKPEEELQPQPVAPPSQGRGTIVTSPTPTGPLPVTPHQTPNMTPSVVLTGAVILAEYNERKQEKQTAVIKPDAEQQAWTPAPIPRSEAPSTMSKEVLTIHQPEKSPEQVILPQQSSQRKFEHMRTEELLALAQTIPLGNGEYLARAYQSGKIDREGLISVLKTANRSGNYREEFRRRSAEYMRRLTATPVFSQPQTANAPRETPTQTADSESDDTASPTNTSTRSTTSPPTSALQNKPLFSLKTITILLILVIGVTLLALM